jgi:LuxR family maltose regulon positive regulatory protein
MATAPAIGELLQHILYAHKGKSGLSGKRRMLCRQLLQAQKSQQLHTAHEHVDLTAALSKREMHILRLLEQGMSKQEIARELHISLNTVKTHVKNIYKKLEVHNRAAAAQISMYRVG